MTTAQGSGIARLASPSLRGFTFLLSAMVSDNDSRPW